MQYSENSTIIFGHIHEIITLHLPFCVYSVVVFSFTIKQHIWQFNCGFPSLLPNEDAPIPSSQSRSRILTQVPQVI